MKILIATSKNYFLFMKEYFANQDPPKINLINREDNSAPRGKKTFRISKFILYLFLVLLVAFFVFSYQVIFTASSLTDIFSGKISFLKQLNILANNSGKLEGESEDRINIALLGIGGEGHDGPYLTDTIIVLSIQPSTKKIAMLSIPRDLLVEIPGYGWWKINNANSFGEEKSPGNGGLLAKDVLTKTLDIPIHYYIRVDFSGFAKIIDDIGGIKIYVDNAFTDYQFPTTDYKYQVVSFDAGWQTMDGETALNFVRSRHGNNGEGSDFARSKRQQKVLQALKDRVLSYDFLFNPQKMNKVTSALADHIRTDLEPWEIIELAKTFSNFDTKNVINQGLDDGPDNYLYASVVNEAFVLKPKGDSFSQIQELIKNIFNESRPQNLTSTSSAATPTAPIAKQEKPRTIRIEIRNGTTISGLASRQTQELKLKGLQVMKIGNSPEQNYTKTEIYKLSEANSTDTETLLQDKYQTLIQEKNIPSWVEEMSAPDTDYFIILGTDAENL